MYQAFKYHQKYLSLNLLSIFFNDVTTVCALGPIILFITDKDVKSLVIDTSVNLREVAHGVKTETSPYNSELFLHR